MILSNVLINDNINGNDNGMKLLRSNEKWPLMKWW